MADKKVFTIPYRRKREDKTDYKKRQTLLKSRMMRLVVRRFNRQIAAQLIEYHPDGDRVVETAHSRNLSEYGWKLNTGNLPAAYLVGFLIGTKAKGRKAILDIGLQTPIPGSRIFAVLKGASDAGLKIKLSEEVLPKEERITGQHMKDAKKVKEAFEKAKEKIGK